MTTVHAYTSTQMLLDGPVRGGNLRAARSAADNTIPHLPACKSNRLSYP